MQHFPIIMYAARSCYFAENIANDLAPLRQITPSARRVNLKSNPDKFRHI